MDTSTIPKSEPFCKFWLKHRASFGEGFKLNHYSTNNVEVQAFSEEPCVFKNSLYNKIKRITSGDESGIFIYLLTAFGILLRYYTGRNLVIIHSPPLPAKLPCPHETIPLLMQIVDHMSVRELLNDIQTQIRRCYNYQDFLLSSVNEKQQALKDQFNSNIRIYYSGLHANNDDPEYLYPLKLELGIRNDQVEITLRYDNQCFDCAFIKRMLQHYCTLIRLMLQLNKRTDSILADISSESLGFFNLSPVSPAGPSGLGTIHDLFRKQAESFPNDIAVVAGKASLTYQKLNDLSDSLASSLRRDYNLVSEDVVAVLLKSSEWIPLALLATLKCGAAFIPIDSHTPDSRVNSILNDAKVKILLTESDFLWRATDFYEGSIVALDLLPDYTKPKDNDLPVISGHSAAYIVFTSGSSGIPKGVVINHSSLVHYTQAIIETFCLQQDDSTVLLSSFAFDLGYTALWGSLISGGTCHFVPSELARNGRSIIAYCFKQGINWIKITPSLGHMMLLSANVTKIEHSRLRLLVYGGEVIYFQDVEKFRALKKDVIIFNHYGPTEATIGCLCQEISESFVWKGYNILGKSILDNKVFIVNEKMEVIPKGLQGQICIAGPGLSRGYLNDPSLTAEKFIYHPVLPGEKVYLSGDFGYLDDEGRIVFLGRGDSQVKIKGYRVEIREVEEAIRAIEEVVDIAVIPQNVDDQVQLTAYLISNETLNSDKFNEQLKKKLPYYMTPVAMIPVSEFPLKPNGKLDVKKLISDYPVSPPASLPTEPQKKLEKALAKLWREVLQKEVIGMNDNFFAIGGHSLKAAQFIYRAFEELRISLNLNDVFENPTLNKLTKIIESSNIKLKPVRSISYKEFYPMSYAQRHIWYAAHLNDQDKSYNRLVAFHLNGILDIKALEKAIYDLIGRHESLRTSFSILDGEPVQKVSSTPPNLGLLEVITQESLDLDSALKWARKEWNTLFDLQESTLFHAFLYPINQAANILYFKFHHIIMDADSMQICLRELVSLYNANVNDRPNPLSRLSIQYRDYTHWNYNQLKGEPLHRMGAYWKTKLGGRFKAACLPTDFTQSEDSELKGAAIFTRLDEALTKEISSFSRKQETTSYIFLVAALKALLYRYTGISDILIGTTVAGRPHLDLHDQVGCFINTLALRTEIEGDKSFITSLDRVKSTIMEAWEHQLYPWSLVLRDLKKQTTNTWSPVFHILVEYQHAGESINIVNSMEGLEGSVFELPFLTPKFDITVFIIQESHTLFIKVEYNTNLYKHESIQLFLDRYVNLIKFIMESAWAPICHVPF